MKDLGASSEEQIVVANLDGPVLPSLQGIKLCKETGNHLYTITNLSAISNAASEGLVPVAFTWVRDNEFTYEKSEFEEKVASVLLNEIKSSDFDEKVNFEKVTADSKKYQEEFAKISVPADLSQYETETVTVPLDNDVELFDKAMETMGSFFNLERKFKFGICIDNIGFNEFIKDFEILY